jgi:hypothetical protein
MLIFFLKLFLVFISIDLRYLDATFYLILSTSPICIISDLKLLFFLIDDTETWCIFEIFDKVSPFFTL